VVSVPTLSAKMTKKPENISENGEAAVCPFSVCGVFGVCICIVCVCVYCVCVCVCV